MDILMTGKYYRGGQTIYTCLQHEAIGLKTMLVELNKLSGNSIQEVYCVECGHGYRCDDNGVLTSEVMAVDGKAWLEYLEDLRNELQGLPNRNTDLPEG